MPGPDCTEVSPTKLTCPTYGPIDLGPYGIIGVFPARVAAAKAALGKTGKLTVTLTADGIDPVKKTVDVHVVEGVDLAADKDSFISVKPGADFTTELQVHNNSKSVVHGVSVTLGTDYAYESKQQFSNCFYDDDRAATACTFDQDLQPGATYQVSMPYRLRQDTVGPYSVSGVFEWLTAGDWDDLIKFLKEIGREEPGTPGNGDTLSLRRVATSKGLKQTDPKPRNNHQFQFIDVDGKGPDLSAVGATVSGAVGTTVTMPVGVKNNGRRDLDMGPDGYPAAAA